MVSSSRPAAVSYLLAAEPTPYYLVVATAPADAPAPKPRPIDHVLLVDVSGSMSGSLGDIADQISNKLPTMIAEGHTLTLIRYSGRGQCETVFRGRPITGVMGSFAAVSDAIRRALRPVGMTAFVDPFIEAKKVITGLRAANPGHEVAVYLQTDGCETEGYTSAQILAAAGELAPLVSSFTVFEYGSYCDRRLLASIAAKVGGEHVPCRGFLDYDPAVQARMGRTGARGAKVVLKTAGALIGSEPFAFSLDGGDITLYGVEDGGVTVPETVTEIAYLSALPVGRVESGGIARLAEHASRGGDHARALDYAYAALAVLVQRQDMDEVFGVLGALADVRFAGLAENAFTRPEFDAVVDAARAAAAGHGRFAEGWDPNRVPRYDAPTVLQTLFILDDPETRIVLDDPAHPFVYARIGRAKDTTALLREEHVAAVQTALEALGSVRLYREEIATLAGVGVSAHKTRNVIGQKLTDALDDFLATMPTVATAKALFKALEVANGEGEAGAMAASGAVLDAIAHAKPVLTFAENKPTGGYRWDGLVFASERANVSVRVRLTGTVDVLPALPDAPWAKALDTATRQALAAVETTTFRAFAILRDGMLNVKKLPVRVGAIVWEKLRAFGLVAGPHHDGVVTLDFASLPVINRAMVTSVRADTLLRAEHALTRLGAALKVVDSYRDLWPRAPGLAAKFGGEIADWLVSVGVRDSGFNPPAPKTKARDIAYHAKVMKIGVAGLSNLPTVAEVQTRVAAIADWKKAPKGKEPKLTAGMALMAPTLEEVDAYLAFHKLALVPFNADTLALFKAWLDAKEHALSREIRALQREQSGRVFVMVAGGARPVDLKPGETTATVTLDDGTEIKGKIEAQLKPVAA